MPHITTSLVSNADEANEVSGVLVQKGIVSHWPPKANRRDSAEAPVEREDGPVPVADQKAAGIPADKTVTIAEQKAGKPLSGYGDYVGGAASAGTSSSTSGDNPGKSGSSPQGTGRSIQSPAQETGNPSAKDQPSKPAQSSSASSAAGSSRGTGASQQSLSSSSGSADQIEGTQGQPTDPKATQAKSRKQGDS